LQYTITYYFALFGYAAFSILATHSLQTSLERAKKKTLFFGTSDILDSFIAYAVTEMRSHVKDKSSLQVAMVPLAEFWDQNFC